MLLFLRRAAFESHRVKHSFCVIQKYVNIHVVHMLCPCILLTCTIMIVPSLLCFWVVLAESFGLKIN